jgi:hypothetical protein
MGRWMEVVRKQPPEGKRQHSPEYETLVVGAIAPHPLLSAARAIEVGSRRSGHSANQFFPMLARVELTSPSYVDEDLWLLPDEVEGLLDEFRRLRRVCQHQEFVPDLDSRKAYAVWRGLRPSAEFEAWLDQIEALLSQAAEGGYWVRLML